MQTGEKTIKWRGILSRMWKNKRRNKKLENK